MSNDSFPPGAVLTDYSLQQSAVELLAGGNINASYAVTDVEGNRYVLQRVNPLFPPEIHEDINAVTQHLAKHAMPTPHLVPNRDGKLYTEQAGTIWRLLTRIEGITLDRVTGTPVAAEAGSVLARFHMALADLDHGFRNPRAGVHDTGRHLRNLETALQKHHGHARYHDIAPLAAEILADASDLAGMPPIPPRKVHGDPKITNILFDATTGGAICLIDFDTLGCMPLPLELGDALRSWCNPGGEDTAATEFALPFLRAALEGYAGEAHGFVTEPEWRAFLPAVYRIYLELAARFCADALNECYFSWDPQRFAGRSEHNEIRARGQLTAARSLQAQYRQAERIVETVFGRNA